MLALPDARRVVDRVRASPGVADLGGSRRRRPAGGRGDTAPEVPDVPDGAPEHVWYASYGSNLLRERFEAYLLGGSVDGLDRTYPGGAGTRPASADRPLVLPGRLRFALDAPAWGEGGVAFWDPDGDGPGVLARAWRVRLQQYLEVVHLENGGTSRAAAPWPESVLRDGEALLGGSWYGRLVLAGHLDGEPVLTFTHPDPGALLARAPSHRYAEVVARGLVETFGPPGTGGLTRAEADAYLAAALSQR